MFALFYGCTYLRFLIFDFIRVIIQGLSYNLIVTSLVEMQLLERSSLFSVKKVVQVIISASIILFQSVSVLHVV